MEKIEKIILDDKTIKMELKNHELYIPLNQEYVKQNINDALMETSERLKDVKFYQFNSNICKLGLTFAVVMYAGCALADFLLLDLMAMLCGGLGGFSLVSLSFLKLGEKKAKTKAYNNVYWQRIRDIALSNIKKNKEKKISHAKVNTNNVKTNNFYNNLSEDNEIKKIYRKI